ncbi:MAG: hypothetical protein PF569_08045 [Candidatus Woesearchaeota archaeon]|jgi:hypothetical protein|nr:hypothetical protein [Candidatus Woesearchaeota archaeon]
MIQIKRKILLVIALILFLISGCSTTSEVENDDKISPSLYSPYSPEEGKLGPNQENNDYYIEENSVENDNNFEEIIIDYEENEEVIEFDFNDETEEVVIDFEDKIELNLPEEDENNRNFRWSYDGNDYGISFNIDKEYYEFFKNRERIRDFDLFASDQYSKDFIESITEELEKYAKESGLSDDEIPYFIISFVQYLPYTSDDVTTGFDEYPRFPYETFYENGGDCEDTSILASAILNEMGYGVALLTFPGHVAVGVKCDHDDGESYYSYQGNDYCYLETTGENWDIGTIPENIESEKAIVNPIYSRSKLEVDFTSSYSYNNVDVYTDVDVIVKNLGSKDAENTKVYVALLTSDESKVWDSVTSKKVDIDSDGSYEFSVTNLHSPSGYAFKIYVVASNDEVTSNEASSNWINWE